MGRRTRFSRRATIAGMRVLVIEDDRRMASLLEQGLREEGNQVTLAHNGVEGLSIALQPTFDVIVLDLMLPGMDGFELTRRLRQEGTRTPVLMLTARDAPIDMVKGLDLGADDYVTKPFALDVLLARIRAAARRGPATQSVVLKAGTLSMNTASRSIQVDGRGVTLTRTEYSILEVLMRRRDRVVTREELLAEIWGDRGDVESNTLDAFMKLIRGKIDLSSESRLIQTVRGVGYILRSNPE
jgi:DNA-binding response OmpR family regulator